jgi:hypothetical protein
MKVSVKLLLKFIVLMTLVICYPNCSSSPDWLTNKWDLVSYGTKPKGIMGNFMANALGQRFYWEIHGNRIDGYMQKGWQGTLTSLFFDESKPKENEYEKRAELKFKIISSNSKECHIEILEGTELYAITSIVKIREVIKDEHIIFKNLGGRLIAMDRIVNLDDNSIQNRAAKILMQQSASLVKEDGKIFHRLILEKSFK